MSQRATKFKYVQAKKLVKSNKLKKMFFCEIAFLSVLKHFPSSKNDFWPYLKLQKVKFGQKNFVKLIYLIHEFFWPGLFLILWPRPLRVGFRVHENPIFFNNTELVFTAYRLSFPGCC